MQEDVPVAAPSSGCEPHAAGDSHDHNHILQAAQSWWTHALEKYLGDMLIKHDGDKLAMTTIHEALKDKKVGVLFGGSWSTRNRYKALTSGLAQWYTRNASDFGIEIVFVSLDQDILNFERAFADMPWLALPFGRHDISKVLCEAVGDDDGVLPQMAIFSSESAELIPIFKEQALREWLGAPTDCAGSSQAGIPVGCWLHGNIVTTQTRKKIEPSGSLEQELQRLVLQFAGAQGLMDSIAKVNSSENGGAGDIVNRLRGDSQGWTPLMFAALEGQLDALRCLALSGSNVNAVDDRGATALHKAAAGGHIKVIDELIKCGADPLVQDKEGRTVLHYAAAHGQHTAIRHLVTCVGVDTAAATVHGHTPLHRAAFNGHISASRMLLKLGSDARSEDEDGQTPQQLARSSLKKERYEKFVKEVFLDADITT